jgi:aminoglycoside phosphotransferase (APT) family kinase protein
VFSQSVPGFFEDSALPALAQVLNTEMMLRQLSELAGPKLADRRGLRCTAEVLNHKPGKRCTFRCTLTRANEVGQAATLVAVIGKIYAKQALAERQYRRAKALRDGPFCNSFPLCIPAPIMLNWNLGLILQENVAGAHLRHCLSAKTDGPLALTGQWLANFHAAGPVAGLKLTTSQDELKRVNQWCEDIASHFAPTDLCAQRIGLTQRALYRLANAMPAYEPVMIHRDFSHDNVLWDGERLWGLDFDEMAIGDPALDVGHFLAQWEALASADTAQVFAEAADRFLRSYQERTLLQLDFRLSFYKACTFLKVAANKVKQKKANWKHIAEALVALACREID